MEQDRYIQPKNCEKDKSYYIKISGNSVDGTYQEVRFLSYRPHPAEVLIHDGDRIRVIHRSFLYIKESGSGGHG